MTRDPVWLCHRCQGFGEVRHPRWGSYSCPEPTVECPECGGTGGYTTETRADTSTPGSDALRAIDAESGAMSA